MNNKLLTGVNLKVFFSSDVGNSSPSSSLLKQVNEIAAFPAVTVQNQAAKIETYDSDYASVLMGDKSIEAFPITVNLMPDDISHQYLTQAADNQLVLQVKVQYEEAEDQEAFILLNGYISSYSDSGDKDSAVTRSFIFTPETLVAQGIAEIQPVLRQGDFGVGSNGVDTPQYQLPMAGNGFIQIPGTSIDNPASANLIGIGLTNQGRESGFVISESGDLKLYARNSSTAWTRIYSSTEQDLRYVQRTVTVNGHPLLANITLSKNDVALGNVTNDAQLKVSSNLSDLNNVSTAKTNLGIDKVLNVPSYSKTESDSTFVPKTLKVNGHALDSDIVLQPSDIGIIPVANGGTGQTTAPAAATALGLGVSNDVTHRNLALINSGSDAIVSLNGSIIRGNSNNALIIGSTGGFFIRPKGDGTASPQLSFDANGVFDLTATNVKVGGTLSTTGNASSGGTLSVRNALTLSSTGDAIADINGFKLRATPAGVTVISTPNQAINIRPKGDTDTSQTVIINPTNNNVLLSGMTLTSDGLITANNGITARKTIQVSPLNGQNTEWATIGFFDSTASAIGPQRGAVFSDKDGGVGLMNKGGTTATFTNDNAFIISKGGITVGANNGGTGENNDGRTKAVLYNKGWLECYGSNAYQQGDGKWVRQVNGLMIGQQGTTSKSELYQAEIVGERSSFNIHVAGFNKDGWYEFRNDGLFAVGGTNPMVNVGPATVYSDGNISGTRWSNQAGGTWNNYLSNWLGANGVSDIKYKENIVPTTRVALDTVKQMKFVDFDWKEEMRPQKYTDSVSGGWLSQDLEKIDPSLVNHLFDGEFVNPDISTVLPLAFKAIQELSEKNAKLEERLTKLESNK